MNTVQNLFQQAQLAEAAYVNFFDKAGSLITTNAGLVTALTNSKFSQAQAVAFAAEWSVVSQQPNTVSGFSATVFKNNVTGEYVFAACGTEPKSPFDWATNLGDIGADGIAISQGIDMFNYYQRLIGVPGKLVAQYAYFPEIITPATNGSTPSMVPARIERMPDVLAAGELTAQPTLTAVGHSMGGHLAMMLSRMTAHVGSVTTLVAPGFDSASRVNPLTADGFFSLLGAATGLSFMTNGWDTTNMTHLDVQGDLVHIIGTTPGSSQNLFSEYTNKNPISAHDKSAITDSLAVYNLLATLDPGLTLADITGILKASSNVAENSLESAVSALGKLFNVSSASKVGSTRNELYVALDAIRSSVNVCYGIVALDVMDAATLATSAKGDIAYRYALVSGNPFVVSGADYSNFNQNGELDAYDLATGRGQLTDQYLIDRSGYLIARLRYNSSDGMVSTLQNIRYHDVETHTTLNPINAELSRVTFGGASSDFFSGANGDDSLYGEFVWLIHEKSAATNDASLARRKAA